MYCKLIRCKFLPFLLFEIVFILFLSFNFNANAGNNSIDVLMQGTDFNTTIKRLCNGAEFDYSCVDDTVKKIVFCPNNTICDIYAQYYNLPSANIGVGKSSTARAYYNAENQFQLAGFWHRIK